MHDQLSLAAYLFAGHKAATFTILTCCAALVHLEPAP